jgi:transglutaminase-like putative cysteine protease
MTVMRILFLGALSMASMYFAQSYPASAIPENLKKNANAVVRKDLTTIQINKIDDITYQYYTATTVLNKDGDSQAMAYISYEKGDDISDVKVNIYDESGKKVKSYSKSDFGDFANNSQGTFYSDNRVMALSFTPTQYPYTVEFSYQIGEENTVFLPDFIPFKSTNVSLEEAQMRIINKSGIELKTKTYPSKYNYTSVIENDNGEEKTYTYKSVPAIDDVFLLPQPVKILPKVSFALTKFNLEGKQGSISNWGEFGSWYYNSILQPVSLSTPAIKAEVAALNLQGTTEEKVKKLYQYMQTKTRYIFVALGIGGWQPMLPDEVDKKGYGDCKGLTNYMKTLLDEAGIPSYYSVINSSASPISFDPAFPKMGGNHVILMVPTEKGNIWLENTSQQVAFNHLNYTTTDRNVLSIRKNGIELIDTPIYSAEQNKEKQLLKIKLNEDNSILGEGNFSFTGIQYDNNMALTNLSPKDRNEAVKNLLDVLHFEKIEMKNFLNDRDNAIAKFDLDFKANNYSKNAGSSIIFRAVPIFSDNVYKIDENRELPFELRQSFEDEYEINFTIPKNYKIDEIPENVTLNSEFGSYKLSFVKNGEELKVNRIIRINKGLYPKEKYNDYVNFRKKTINIDNSKILITKI